MGTLLNLQNKQFYFENIWKAVTITESNQMKTAGNAEEMPNVEKVCILSLQNC
jgi:hypothetical protein